MTGTLVNTAAIVAGGLLGLLIKNGLPRKIGDSITKVEGIAIMVIGLNGLIGVMIAVGDNGRLASSGEILLLVSLVLGVLAGELLKIEDGLERLGRAVENKFKAQGFAAGFVTATILFCVGAMAIVGSLNDGLTGDASILFVKSALDGIAAMLLASTMGFGVVFAAVPVLLYQGTISLLAGLLSPLISTQMLDGICMVGYAIVLCIGINFVFQKGFKTANMLPALLVPIIYEVLKGVIPWL